MSSVPNSRSRATEAGNAGNVAGTRAWRSLGARLALWYLAVTVASFVVVAGVFALHTHAWVEHEGQRSAETLLERYRRAFEAGGTEALRALVADEDGAKLGVAVRVTDERDVDILAVSSDDTSGRVAAALREKGHAPAVEAPKDWHVAVARISQGRRLEVLVHDDEGPRVWKNAREVLWLIIVGGLLSAIVGAFVISRRALRPIGDLARVTQNILESGDLALRVPVHGSADDLEQLGVLFNRLLARNERLVRAMKESLDNVAHDLRTPLARLRAGAELALRNPPEAAKTGDALADVIEETDRVLGMLTMLMDITEAEAGAMHLDRKTEDLASIAREAVELYEFVSSERGVHVVTRLAPGVLVVVDRRRILQACANLVDNAIKYTPPGGRVEVSVTSHEAWGIVSVADTGPGVEPADRPRVWERLFRGDRSRSERGLGLGLSLVKAVIEAHGGQARLRSDAKIGSTFEVLLPLARAAKLAPSK